MARKVDGVTSPAKVDGLAPGKVDGVAAGGGGGGGITHRSGSPYHAYASSVGSVAVTAGDLIVVGMSGGSGADTNAPSDGVNTYYLALFNGLLHGSADGAVWYAVAATTTTLTISVVDYTDPGLSVYVLIGADTASPIDGTPVQYVDPSDTINHQTGSMAVTNSGLLFAYWFNETSGAPVSGADSWVLTTNEDSHLHATFEKAYSGSGSPTASMTSDSSSIWACIFVAIKAA